MSTSVRPPLDIDGLLSQVDGDEQLLAAVLEAFRQEWPRRAAEATAALAQADCNAAQRALHALVGMLAQLGAESAAAVAAAERCARVCDLELARSHWQSIQPSVASLEACIAGLLEEK